MWTCRLITVYTLNIEVRLELYGVCLILTLSLPVCVQYSSTDLATVFGNGYNYCAFYAVIGQVCSQKILPCLGTVGWRRSHSSSHVQWCHLSTHFPVLHKSPMNCWYCIYKHVWISTVHRKSQSNAGPFNAHFNAESGRGVYIFTERSIYILPWICQSIFIHGQLL